MIDRQIDKDIKKYRLKKKRIFEKYINIYMSKLSIRDVELDDDQERSRETSQTLENLYYLHFFSKTKKGDGGTTILAALTVL